MKLKELLEAALPGMLNPKAGLMLVKAAAILTEEGLSVHEVLASAIAGIEERDWVLADDNMDYWHIIPGYFFLEETGILATIKAASVPLLGLAV